MLSTLVLLSTLFLTSTSLPTPPGIPAATTARTELGSLTVARQGPQTGYSRDKFPHWIIQSGNCDTREDVLKRDGTNVVQGTDCSADSGTWFSPYDGATWTAASDVDIDHVVPLSNAWKVRRYFAYHPTSFCCMAVAISVPKDWVPATLHDTAANTPDCIVWSCFLDDCSASVVRK